jgi:hypothetical protein
MFIYWWREKTGNLGEKGKTARVMSFSGGTGCGQEHRVFSYTSSAFKVNESWCLMCVHTHTQYLIKNNSWLPKNPLMIFPFQFLVCPLGNNDLTNSEHFTGVFTKISSNTYLINAANFWASNKLYRAAQRSYNGSLPFSWPHQDCNQGFCIH